MAEGLNRVTLIGNLGADPELKYTQNGQAVLRLRLATTESYVNRAGERQQRTDWHTAIVWGKRGEALNNILSKGRSICVEGRIQYRQWEDKDGTSEIPPKSWRRTSSFWAAAAVVIPAPLATSVVVAAEAAARPRPTTSATTTFRFSTRRGRRGG